VVCGDKLIEGFRGMATELGHITVSAGWAGLFMRRKGSPGGGRFPARRLQNNVSEQIAAGPEMQPYFRSIVRPADLRSCRTWRRVGQGSLRPCRRFIGQATADFLHLFNPSIVIFGGGVTLSGALLLDPVKDSLRRHIMDESYLDGLVITTAELGDDAGLLGSLAQAHIKLSNKPLPS